MDNSFDKYNKEYAEQEKSGFKQTFFVIVSYIMGIIGLVLGIYSLLPDKNMYMSLLTLVLGLFGIMAASKAKQGGEWKTMTKIPGILAGVDLVVACFVLYILPYLPFGK